MLVCCSWLASQGPIAEHLKARQTRLGAEQAATVEKLWSARANQRKRASIAGGQDAPAAAAVATEAAGTSTNAAKGASTRAGHPDLDPDTERLVRVYSRRFVGTLWRLHRAVVRAASLDFVRTVDGVVLLVGVPQLKLAFEDADARTCARAAAATNAPPSTHTARCAAAVTRTGLPVTPAAKVAPAVAAMKTVRSLRRVAEMLRQRVERRRQQAKEDAEAGVYTDPAEKTIPLHDSWNGKRAFPRVMALSTAATLSELPQPPDPRYWTPAMFAQGGPTGYDLARAVRGRVPDATGEADAFEPYEVAAPRRAAQPAVDGDSDDDDFDVDRAAAVRASASDEERAEAVESMREKELAERLPPAGGQWVAGRIPPGPLAAHDARPRVAWTFVTPEPAPAVPERVVKAAASRQPRWAPGATRLRGWTPTTDALDAHAFGVVAHAVQSPRAAVLAAEAPLASPAASDDLERVQMSPKRKPRREAAATPGERAMRALSRPSPRKLSRSATAMSLGGRTSTSTSVRRRGRRGSLKSSSVRRKSATSASDVAAGAVASQVQRAAGQRRGQRGKPARSGSVNVRSAPHLAAKGGATARAGAAGRANGSRRRPRPLSSVGRSATAPALAAQPPARRARDVPPPMWSFGTELLSRCATPSSTVTAEGGPSRNDGAPPAAREAPRVSVGQLRLADRNDLPAQAATQPEAWRLVMRALQHDLQNDPPTPTPTPTDVASQSSSAAAFGFDGRREDATKPSRGARTPRRARSGSGSSGGLLLGQLPLQPQGAEVEGASESTTTAPSKRATPIASRRLRAAVRRARPSSAPTKRAEAPLQATWSNGDRATVTRGAAAKHRPQSAKRG